MPVVIDPEKSGTVGKMGSLIHKNLLSLLTTQDGKNIIQKINNIFTKSGLSPVVLNNLDSDFKEISALPQNSSEKLLTQGYMSAILDDIYADDSAVSIVTTWHEMEGGEPHSSENSRHGEIIRDLSQNISTINSEDLQRILIKAAKNAISRKKKVDKIELARKSNEEKDISDEDIAYAFEKAIEASKKKAASRPRTQGDS
jgi:hypothetical protein